MPSIITPSPIGFEIAIVLNILAVPLNFQFVDMVFATLLQADLPTGRQFIGDVAGVSAFAEAVLISPSLGEGYMAVAETSDHQGSCLQQTGGACLAVPRRLARNPQP